jgi:hypothetical protein
MASLRQCTRCGYKHEPPVGKKCKRALQALPDTQVAQAVDTVMDDVGDQVTGGVEDHVSSLVSVISQLVTRLDSQQEQLDHLQAAVANHLVSHLVRWTLVKVKVPYLYAPAVRRPYQCQLTTSLCRI